MPITQEELARRLKDAREASGLTQEEVAGEVGLPRGAVVQIEAGKRAVNSLELYRFARLYGRRVDDFLREEEPQADPVTALFRISTSLPKRSSVRSELSRCASLARELQRLEALLEIEAVRSAPVAYDPRTPSSRWVAITQGRDLAEEERNRLQLGDSPVGEVAGVIREAGVRVTELEMPDDISGLFFHGPDHGLVIVVNRAQSRTRRTFSYAHEYCHALVDRDQPATVSRTENQDELSEVRANAFAAHFLLPERGVRAFVRVLGKDEAGRKTQEIFTTGEGEVTAQSREPSASRELQVHDVVAVARHFGVSYLAALYHLLNLKILSAERFEELRRQEEQARRIQRAFRIPEWEDKGWNWTLAEQVFLRALEAHRRGLISRAKALELAVDSGIDSVQAEEALDGEPGEADEILIPS